MTKSKKSGSRPKRKRPQTPNTQSSRRGKEPPRGQSVNGGKAGKGRIEVDFGELKQILSKVKGMMSDGDFEKLDGAVETLAFLTAEVEAKGATILRLRKLIFGSQSEKTRDIIGSKKKPSSTAGDEEGEEPSSSSAVDEKTQNEKPEQSWPWESGDGNEQRADENTSKDDSNKDENEEPKRRKGHGRNAAGDYTGAQKHDVKHETLSPGSLCPACEKGRVYRQPKPAVRVRVTGVAPLNATVYSLERLRCNLCGEVFTAKEPEGIGSEKYDLGAVAMICLLKYGCGFPFFRLEKLERYLGIPLPDATQWSVIWPAIMSVYFYVYTELIGQAAQGKILHTDDTKALILEFEKLQKAAQMEQGKPPPRKGTFTSGIVSLRDEIRIALFFTGQEHAGENLERVLAERSAELSMPMQMSDGLSWNNAGETATLECHCNVHARRKFADVYESFPDEVRFVLESYKKVYKNEDTIKAAGMNDDERLAFHQKHSKPVMEAMKEKLDGLLINKLVEDNSGLGTAIKYLQKHWSQLTQFLKTPGAAIDNNIAERALKMSIIHRKNSMFFKNSNGAAAGDICMSLIHTCELNQLNPFDYLVELQKNADRVRLEPQLWMPWNYAENLLATVD